MWSTFVLVDGSEEEGVLQKAAMIGAVSMKPGTRQVADLALTQLPHAVRT